jgi:cysteine-rich repeat protein
MTTRYGSRFSIVVSIACIAGADVAHAVCPDGTPDAGEQCDDGNLTETDGCTSQCKKGVVCNSIVLPGGDQFAVDPASGHCYASFDDDLTTFASAELSCEAAGPAVYEGYLATITSGAEDSVVLSVQHPAQNPWIGAADDANDTDVIFAWVTGEPFGYSHFAPGEPDDDVAFGGLGECLHIANSLGEWNDTNCDFAGFVAGRICELPEPGVMLGFAVGATVLVGLCRRRLS